MFRQDCSEIARFSLGGDNYEDSACSVESAFHHVEQLTCKYFSPGDVKKKCIDFYEKGLIDVDFYVNDWDALYLELGILVRTRFESPEYICKDGEFETLKLVKPGFAHLVPGDGQGHYSWDSLGTRPEQKDYIVYDKRIMKYHGTV